MTKQSKHVAPYPPEFRAEAIRLARTSGKPHAQIARDLGMTSETLSRLFEPFVQARLDYSQGGGGLGLGLGGAKRLVSDFEISSRLGEGTRVSITRWK